MLSQRGVAAERKGRRKGRRGKPGEIEGFGKDRRCVRVQWDRTRSKQCK